MPAESFNRCYGIRWGGKAFEDRDIQNIELEQPAGVRQEARGSKCRQRRCKTVGCS